MISGDDSSLVMEDSGSNDNPKTPDFPKKSETAYDVLIIGAGPVGLFGIFELGLLNLQCHLIDNLDKVGGQCSELYPEKPIYDIPSRVRISAQELTDELMRQSKPFKPVFHLNQQAEKITKSTDQLWKITTSTGNSISALWR